MGKLFGTDGVRGVAGKDLTCELALQIGRGTAAVLFFFLWLSRLSFIGFFFVCACRPFADNSYNFRNHRFVFSILFLLSDFRFFFLRLFCVFCFSLCYNSSVFQPFEESENIRGQRFARYAEQRKKRQRQGCEAKYDDTGGQRNID